MAKQTIKKITIATIIAIIALALTVGNKIWNQGGTHAAEAAQVQANKEDIKEMKPEIKLNTEARIDVEWIKGSLKRIEDKL